MLSVLQLNVTYMLSMLSAVVLSVVMLNVVILSVVALLRAKRSDLFYNCFNDEEKKVSRN
jgi:hypothetical protein